MEKLLQAWSLGKSESESAALAAFFARGTSPRTDGSGISSDAHGRHHTAAGGR